MLSIWRTVMDTVQGLAWSLSSRRASDAPLELAQSGEPGDAVNSFLILMYNDQHFTDDTHLPYDYITPPGFVYTAAVKVLHVFSCVSDVLNHYS